MTPDTVVQILRHMLLAAFWLGAPLLAVGFIAGIVVSLVQIATSIQDNAFSAVPRLVAFLASLLLLMPWMIEQAMSYATGILGDLARYAR
jgi:flagellar biosynthesis protein FliQ